MRRIMLVALAALLIGAGWTAVLGVGWLEGWLRKPLAPRGDVAAFAAAADDIIARESRGNVAFALIRGGQSYHERFKSVGAPVGRDTVFQVASLSKWITALGVMSLVDAGKVDLDAPVEPYLKRWKLPPGEFDNRQVTVRRLLSHTAGLTDGLGYGGFKPGEPVQPLPASLTRASDASPGRDGVVRVGLKPGSQWRYSGGGYAILQLLIEDITGEPFNAYMRRAVMLPMGMTNSTFETPADGAADVAEFYDAAGKLATHYRFSAPSAAGLYTSAADLEHLIAAVLPGPDGAQPGRGVVTPESLALMRKPQGYQYGVEIWGLGQALYAPNNAGSFIVGHDGNNDPAINTAARYDPASGDGVVVLETGNKRLATNLAGEWVFWKTGHIDFLVVLMELKQALMILASGWFLIILGSIVVGWRLRRPAVRRAAPTT
jgi:CubicO group peptidase (beta-lactamase class C family)